MVISQLTLRYYKKIRLCIPVTDYKILHFNFSLYIMKFQLTCIQKKKS